MGETTDDLLDDWWDVKGREVRRMDDKALKAFVLGFLDNTIYTSTHLRNPDDTRSGRAGSWATMRTPQTTPGETPWRWEYWDKALPRGVNGRPMFGSVRIMHLDDWTRALKAKEREHRETIEI